MGEWGRRGEGREGHGKEKGRHPEGAGRDAVLAMFWLLEDAEEPVHEERGHRRAHKWREAWNGEAVLPVVDLILAQEILDSVPCIEVKVSANIQRLDTTQIL